MWLIIFKIYRIRLCISCIFISAALLSVKNIKSTTYLVYKLHPFLTTAQSRKFTYHCDKKVLNYTNSFFLFIFLFFIFHFFHFFHFFLLLFHYFFIFFYFYFYFIFISFLFYFYFILLHFYFIFILFLFLYCFLSYFQSSSKY